MPDRTPKTLYYRWRDLTWRGPALGWLIAFAIVIVVGLAALLAAGIIGANQGLAERSAAARAQIEEHYTNALAHLGAGRTELAAAEFERVLRLDPQNSVARAQLDALLAPPPTATPSDLVQPILVPPDSDSATPTTSPQALLFAQVQQAIEKGELTLGEALIDELSQLDPDYRKDEVTDLRFALAYGRGLKLVQEGSVEQALRAFDEALALRPDDPDANQQRDLAALYADALGAWRIDWDRTVRLLQAIYDLRPDYLDVADRLITAQVRWGDALAREGQWCQAADHYAIALKSSSDQGLQDSHKQAAEYCLKPPTPTPDLTVTETITSASGVDSGPASGLGRLAFAAYATEFNRWAIYRLDVGRGEQPRILVENGSQPALSPAGSELALHSERGDLTGIGVMTLGENAWRRVTTFAEDSHPRWSPDGQQIVFDSDREGDRKWRIYRMWSGGGDLVSLGFGQWPVWSRQGKTIAYQGCDDAGNRCGLWLMAPDGTNRRPVTDAPGDVMPTWSPDGSRLAFASADRSGNWDIYMVNVQSGGVTPLVASGAIDAHPVWSPDGAQVAFLSNQDGSWAIYVVELATGRVSQVVAVPGTLPDWQEAQISWER
jgi:tetratricopeptide (TPR) repeat protein